MRTWLVLDMNGLAHRAFHSTGTLRYGNTPTGVTFGVFGEILKLQNRFSTEDMVFCFDYGRGLRYDLYPEYKSTRKKQREKWTTSEKKKHEQLEWQIKMMRRLYLPEDCGYRNVFYQKGYEADDIIASVCQNVDPDDEVMIVSSDSDMFQLIRKNVRVYNPRTEQIMTQKRFIDKYGIKPKHWSVVLAIAGCSTDDVKGIFGIGEQTAIAYLNGGQVTEKRLEKIKLGSQVIKRNTPLVHLPLQGTKPFKPKPDRNVVSFERLYRKLNFKTLQSRVRF